MFKDKLYYIVNDLSKHKRNRHLAFKAAVQERLELSTKVYEEQLVIAEESLKYRDAIMLLKKINRS